jgi:hypothetical protein
MAAFDIAAFLQNSPFRPTVCGGTIRSLAYTFRLSDAPLPL